MIIQPLTIASIAAVSPNPRNTAVSSINVTFSVPISTGSLTAGACAFIQQRAQSDHGRRHIKPGFRLDVPDQRAEQPHAEQR